MIVIVLAGIDTYIDTHLAASADIIVRGTSIVKLRSGRDLADAIDGLDTAVKLAPKGATL